MRASGQLDEDDIERAIAAVESALAARERIAIYAEVDVTGISPKALWKDITYGLGKLGELRRFPRSAVVTDQDWVRWIAQAEDALLPGVELRVFSPSQKDVALAWASEPLPEIKPEAEPTGPAVRLIATTRPDVLAFEVDGKVGAADVQHLLAVFNQVMATPDRVRILVRIRAFDGATLAALRQDGLLQAKLRSWRKVERYALVGAPAWLQGLTRGIGPLLGIETRCFVRENEAEAWQWLEAGPARHLETDGAT
jgi:hypothetical protein